MRVALIHDWLTGMRGGERVLEALIDIFPDADIFTLVHVPGSVSERIESRPIHVSVLGALPLSARFYRHALPMLPALVERFDLRRYQLVMSSSHCVAKGAVAAPGVPHVSYCHTPMRYVWDQFDAYFGRGRASIPVRLAMRTVAPRLRAWDRASARRITSLIANSKHVRTRIASCWNRDAAVIHPPVDIERFRPATQRDDFYLSLGALVPYKRVDLTIEAFKGSDRRLVVIGDGPERDRLRSIAGSNVRFLGRVDDAEVADWLGRCRALVHSGVEDFGIALVEALAAGAPVIAFAEGGAAEIVTEPDSPAPATGVLFREQSPESLRRALHSFEARSFDVDVLRARARDFAPERFRSGVRAIVRPLLAPAAA
jgi:glycosyltransferase involved in cell wall biosynthesis